MKILLLGEYSRLHNSLKEGLIELGHEVFLAGYSDDFKDFPVDYKFELNFKTGFKSLLKKTLYRLFNIDLHSLSILKQFKQNQHLFKDYDVVQLINENTFKTLPKTEVKILDLIFSNNSKVFLLSCGTDFSNIKYAYDGQLRYSILTPLEKNKVSEKKYQPILQFLSKENIMLHDYLFDRINGVIASDIDYHIPLIDNSKYIGMIPNPIHVENLKVVPIEKYTKITIFHGINEQNYFKKGSDLFEKSLYKIAEKYQEKVEIITVRSLPYHQYISSYDKAHIILDQVYSYDQGYNALEAMAKGKVVFTGAEKEWLDFYGIEKDTVVINAEPNVEQIVKKLEWLIKNPDKIIEISNNARKFIEDHHNYIDVAQTYIDTWENA